MGEELVICSEGVCTLYAVFQLLTARVNNLATPSCHIRVVTQGAQPFAGWTGLSCRLTGGHSQREIRSAFHDWTCYWQDCHSRLLGVLL